MKKLISLIMIFALALSLIACDNTDKDDDENPIDDNPKTSDVHDSPDPEDDERLSSTMTDGTLIIDNANREFTYTSAILHEGVNTDGIYGESYIEGANGDAFIGTYTPEITEAGFYKIYLMWPEVVNASDSVSLEVTYEGGGNTDLTRKVDQTINGGRWVMIGTYYLAEGSGNSVSVLGEDGSVYTDAAMFDLSYGWDVLQEEEPFEEVVDFEPGSKTDIVKTMDGSYQLSVDGELFFAKGICGVDELELIAAAGGNSARTYSIAALEDGAILDQAEELGVKIVVGIWMDHESGSFNYADHPASVLDQFEKIKVDINRYKDHPAVLAWAVGNEVDKSTSLNKPKIYEAMNDIAKYIQEVDPYHPTMAILAGSSTTKINYLRALVPHIDIIGFNSYKHIGNVEGNASEWRGPYMLTEYGMNQPMDMTLKTAWGAIIEPSNEEKGNLFYDRYFEFIYDLRNDGVVGSYAFKDTGSFRITHTWYGLIVDGMKTPQYYKMSAAWNQTDPVYSVMIDNVTINDLDRLSGITFDPDEEVVVHVEATNPEGTPMSYHYEVRREVSISTNTVPAVLQGVSFTQIDGQPERVTMNTPKQPGAYRVYVYVTDGVDDISTYNVPFVVEGEPFVLEDQENVEIITIASSVGYEEIGSFSNSSNRLYDGIYTRFTLELGAYAQFTAQTMEPGLYDVYYYNLSEGMGQSDDILVQIEIHHNNGEVETLELNLTTTPEGWISLGQFGFTTNEDGFVRVIKVIDGSRVTRATAVAFLPVT